MNKGILRYAVTDSITEAELLPHYIAIHGLSGQGGRVANANVPKQYRDVLVADSVVRDAESAIYAKLDDYVKTFVRQFGVAYKGSTQIKGLYIYSPKTGNGKTTTACALLNEYIVRHYVGSIKRGLQPKLFPAYFFDVNYWNKLYTQFTRHGVPRHVAEKASAEYYEMERIARSTEFLVMDDIGVREDVSDAFRMDLHALINHRNVEEMPTVYTSNVPLTELPRIFREDRLADRIRDMTIQFTFKGDSKRGAKRK
ncbi:DNA replication protein [Bacillus cereus]|nr:DNA replication protein [Bacillus cereus]